MIIRGTHDDNTIDQLERCVRAEEGARAVLCADGHRGYSMPIGGVVAYRQSISPSGVGYDIACGNMAVQTNIMAADLSMAEREQLGDEIQRRISFGIGRKNNEPCNYDFADEVMENIALSPIRAQARMAQMAANQLGTVGSGNHYVDVLEDEAGCVWVACHFGSRGFGHKTATGFMNIAKGLPFDAKGGSEAMDEPPLLFGLGTSAGQDYITGMTIAGQYAYAGRRAVVAKVLEILGAEAEFTVHNHHNYAWPEVHDGELYWVVRKGATPAFPNQFGFVGGSMGDISVILRGVEGAEAKDNLYSTVHGAGRVMSRTAAAGKQRWIKAWCCLDYRHCDCRMLARDVPKGFGAPGLPNPLCPKCGHKTSKKTWMERDGTKAAVNFEAEKLTLAERGIVLRGAGADEAPPVYRPLQSVLDAHSGSIEIVHTLKPLIVVMAGGEEHDPYKD